MANDGNQTRPEPAQAVHKVREKHDERRRRLLGMQAQRDRNPMSEGHTIKTVAPHYIGNATTQREALLAVRRVLAKYRPLTLPETSLTMESSTGEEGKNGRYNGK
jgi:hypothetical protein